MSPTADNLPPERPGPEHRAEPRGSLPGRVWAAARYVVSAEPAMVRAVVVAVLAVLVTFGVVVPAGAESTATDVLGGVWAVAALVQGFSTRARVSPVSVDTGGSDEA